MREIPQGELRNKVSAVPREVEAAGAMTSPSASPPTIEPALAPGGLLVFDSWRDEPGRRRHALRPRRAAPRVQGPRILAHAERREAGEQLREALVARKPGASGKGTDK